VDQEESEQNEIDRMKEEIDFTGKVMHLPRYKTPISLFDYRKQSLVFCNEVDAECPYRLRDVLHNRIRSCCRSTSTSATTVERLTRSLRSRKSATVAIVPTFSLPCRSLATQCLWRRMERVSVTVL